MKRRPRVNSSQIKRLARYLAVVFFAVICFGLGWASRDKQLASNSSIKLDEFASKVEKVPAVPKKNDFNNINELWLINKPANNHQIEGYASSDSVAKGAKVNLNISCSSRTNFTGEVLRLGWYGGTGAKDIFSIPLTPCSKQPKTKLDPASGLINLNWLKSYELAIGSNWQEGYYLVKLTNTQGYQSYVPFVVSGTEPQYKVLFVHGSATDAAYNAWGGNSLYQGLTPNLALPRAVKVSLNRPFFDNNGAGKSLSWEPYMIRFLDRHNIGIDYATDTDINKNPGLLKKYKEIIIAGHDEYWTMQMRNGYQDAVKQGTSLAVFAANTAFRPTRYEDDPVTKQADRIIVCYKSNSLDPVKTLDQTTRYSWRGSPFYWPESILLGEIYKGETADSAPLVVANAKSWIFKDTGLKNGDSFPGLVGYEYDEYVPRATHPKSTEVIFKSTLTDLEQNQPRTANSVYYKEPDQGGVFNAGTIQWSWGLDPDLTTYSAALEQATMNIVDTFSR